MMLRRAVVVGGVLLGWAAEALAGGGPQNVAIVVNADSWASQTIANEYISLRAIPAPNVVHLSGLPDIDTIDVDTFRDKILLPVFKVLWDRRVLPHIDYLVYSSDLPTAINLKSDLAAITPQKYQTPFGSINGLTYLYQLVMKKDPAYTQLVVNFYMRRPAMGRVASALTEEDRQALQQSRQLLIAKKWEAAAEVMEPLAARFPESPDLQYNFACCLARIGRIGDALQALELAVSAGWSDRKHAETDADLQPLRTAGNFKLLLTRMDENSRRPFDVQPTMGFRSVDQWDPQGEKSTEGGLRYMLSTVLAVTSGRGNSVSEALNALRRSVAADATHPQGTVYFMDNQDVRAKTRRPAFQSAVQGLEGTGVTGEISTDVLPQSKDDVVGAMLGTASVKWRSAGSTILPGAICEHLTSFGGAMRENAGQTPLSEFIRYGAAASSGTVTEPYAIQAKFPYPFLHVHYARGCSLAEAFYQSVFGPYQLLIVGDPLCQPWARPLQIQVDELEPQQRVSGRLLVEPEVVDTADSDAALDHYELFVDGRRAQVDLAARRFAIDTRELGDGWHELRVVAFADGPIATQSSLVLPLLVDNGGKSVDLEVVGAHSNKITYGEEIVVQAEAAGADSIDIEHHARLLGTIDGPAGTLRIDSRRVGMGPVRLQAFAQLDGKTASSKPVEVLVDQPPPLPPVRGVGAKDLAAGIAMRLDGKPVAVIETTKNADWLADQKPRAGQQLELDAYFAASVEDLYQFQVQGNAASEVWVDGQSLWQAEDSSVGAAQWVLLPVKLAKGRHRFRLQGTIAESPSLLIRFGNVGCRSLNKNRFKHASR